MLVQYRLRSGELKPIRSWAALHEVKLSSAQLSGAVELFEPGCGKLVRFSSRWVHRLHIDVAAQQIQVDLRIGAPIPGHTSAPASAWTFTIQTSKTASAAPWSVSAFVPWVGSPDCMGHPGVWLERSSATRMKLIEDFDFPFDALGLSRKSHVGFTHMRTGVFVATSERGSALAIACVPDTVANGTASVAGKLGIAHFRNADFNFSNSDLRAALVAHLDGTVDGSDGEGSPWYSFFEWPASDHIGPDQCVLHIWNRTAATNAAGLRGTHSGRPWWPVPLLENVKWKKAGRWQRLVLSAPIRKGVLPRLCKLTYGRLPAGLEPGADAVLSWYANETNADNSVAEPDTRTIRFAGKIKLKPEPKPARPHEPAAGQSAADLIETQLADKDSAAIVSWQMSDFTARDARWLNFGSIDICPKAPRTSMQIDCRITGTWTAHRCDVYAEVDLANLPCQFRMSNSGDALPQTLVAQFDVANRLEDELQRPTLPVIASVEKDAQGNALDGALVGSFHMRVRAEAQHDALVQLRLRRESFDRPKGKSLYLQTRPYNFARLWPTDFDEEAGLDFAYWRSDDAEGPQWRLPDATIEFDLAPQTIAEEMERGNRFWDGKSTSYIEAAHPLRYRYSPPTHLKVRPSSVDRRYNRNTNNLSDILDGARVEAFRTELLYPIRMDFEADSNGEPALAIAESGSFLGRPSPNLPLREPDEKGDVQHSASRALADDIFPPDLAEWFGRAVAQADALEDFKREYDELRWSQSANRAQFVARIAQFHVHDPFLPGRQLMLSKGLNAQLRKPDSNQKPGQTRPGSMPPLMNPLPFGTDLSAEQKAADEVKEFLGESQSWGDPRDDGALRAGALHTMEFPSELHAVLCKPGAVSAFIETLSFSALGASGASAVSFDAGRTTFSVEIADGQVWRIRKVRVGRVALLWNKAKHVVVYERSVIPSEQFKDQQTDRTSLGWPILRKTQEYIEPIEMFRVFATEPDTAANSTAFAHGSEFITPRIYVDSAWGRDLRHGYEIPLWNPTDTSGFYPMPLIAITAQAGAGERSRLWHQGPEELYFYSNAQPGKSADSDQWEAFHGLDIPAAGPSRLPISTNEGFTAASVLDSTRLPNPRPGGLRRKRFDLRVRADGPVNLQHGRGETEMLAAGIDVISLARTAAIAAVSAAPETQVGKALEVVKGLNEYAGRVDLLRDEAETFLHELPELYLKYQMAGCVTLERELTARATELFARLDGAAANAFANVPDLLNMAAGKDALIERLRGEMFEWALPPTDGFSSVVKEFRSHLASAAAYVDSDLGKLQAFGSRLRATFDLCEQTIFIAKKKVDERLVMPITAAVDAVKAVGKQVGELSNDVTAMLASEGANFRSAAQKVRQNADQLATFVQALSIPRLAPLLKGLESTLRAVSQVATEGATMADTDVNRFQSGIRASTAIVQTTMRNLCVAMEAIGTEITAAVSRALFDPLDQLRQSIHDQLFGAFWNDVNLAKAAIHKTFELVGPATDKATALLEAAYQTWREDLRTRMETLASTLGTALQQLSLPVVKLCAELRSVVFEMRRYVSQGLQDLRDEILGNANQVGLISKLKDACNAGQAQLDELKRGIEAKFREVAAAVEERVTGVVTSLLDDATVQSLAGWEKEMAGYQDVASKSLKLVKAIGSLPELPHLKFNADRVEYLFDDLKQQIDTSPFAARLREIDSGLKELGLVVPVRQLLDQMVPDNLQQLDFNKVFRDLGGIDFRKLFSKFRIPGLDKDQVKITHGIDKPTRTAWVKAVVSTSYMEPQEVFGLGPLMVRTAAMSLQARSDVKVALDGRRNAETTGLLRADWTLEFKGAPLVTFRDVTVKLDGGKFHFNLRPDNVELHPSLKFISDIAKRIGERIPPCIELVRDSRGVICGARANLSTVIERPPPLGAVRIGPLSIIGGLSLTLEEGCRFAISAHMSVGTKSAPIFVQINFLGGGMWLDVEARFVDGEITYIGNMGLALGSTESFNIGGVARGSYSLLLFAYASFKSPGGGSLRAGLSIQGSARVLGIVNAYLRLLLEVIHSEGRSRGQGLLDLEIKIGRWYSINVHKQVERSL